MGVRCELCGGIALDNMGLAEPNGETCERCGRWVCRDCVVWDVGRYEVLCEVCAITSDDIFEEGG